MLILLWFLVGACVASLFLKKQTWRIDSMDLIGAFFVMVGWPIYLVAILLMRLFNGDWK